MKTLTMTAGAVIACLLAGCGSQPPQELRNARSAYQELAQSPAATIAPAEVYEAKKSLDVAEKTFADDGNEPETRDLAYVAERKAIIARARANAMLAMQQKQMALQEAERIKQQQAVATREQLGQAKEQLSKTQEQLDSERQARVAAEQRTADALIKIQGLSAKQETRGLVLTISGQVLFATGKSELLPTAQKRLDDVVTALKEDPRQMTIVGHTDNTGDDEKNMQLSQKRADAVRLYLVAHGVPDGRVTAQGMGETQPTASNKTAEGRANNRRVEIILHGSASPEGAPMPGTGQQKSKSGDTSGMQPSSDKPTTTKPGGKQKPATDKPQPGSGTQPEPQPKR